MALKIQKDSGNSPEKIGATPPAADTAPAPVRIEINGADRTEGGRPVPVRVLGSTGLHLPGEADPGIPSQPSMRGKVVGGQLLQIPSIDITPPTSAGPARIDIPRHH